MNKTLVLGASGMLGSAVFRLFAQSPEYEVTGSLRSASSKTLFPDELRSQLEIAGDIENADALTALLLKTRPQVVINCIGLIKQLGQANDPLSAIPVNALLPHRIARLCGLMGARMVHVSTDCVFSGSRGGYTERDFPDANDLYGRSKLMGEVDYPHAITLRTSIIGHELASANGLVGWFLSQQGSCKGYQKAVFSGLPTVELARVIRDVVLPRPELHGLYHVSSAPINKLDLLKMVAETYGTKIDIVADSNLVIDRSLDSRRFTAATGYIAPAWPALIQAMHNDQWAQHV